MAAVRQDGLLLRLAHDALKDWVCSVVDGTRFRLYYTVIVGLYTVYVSVFLYCLLFIVYICLYVVFVHMQSLYTCIIVIIKYFIIFYLELCEVLFSIVSALVLVLVLLAWKGGKLVPLHKGKLPPSDPAGYRSIYISDFTSKLYHMTLRQALVRSWEDAISTIQMGGRKGCGTDVTHHALQTHHFWAHQSGHPAAIVFFDLKAAFYSVIRQALLDIPADDNGFAVAMERLGMSPTRIHELLQQAHLDHACPGLSKHFQLILRDVFHQAHFWLDGVNTPCVTTRGSRPGDPIADVAFNLIMRLVLMDMIEELATTSSSMQWIGSYFQPGTESFGDIPPYAFFDVSFVDDVAVALHGPSNAAVQQGIQSIITAFVKAAAKRGLDTNFDSGKTEILWSIRGPGTRLCKTQLALAGQQLCWRVDDIDYAVHVVSAYRHLGTWLQDKGVCLRDAKQRAHHAKAAWGALARSFYSRRTISQATKTKVFQTLSISRMMYNVHTWTGISNDFVDQWSNMIRQPLMRMAKAHTYGLPAHHLDHASLAALAGLLPLPQQRHAAILRYLKRIVTGGPQLLWTFLFATADMPGSWLSQCREALTWLYTHLPHKPSIAVDAPWDDWLTFISLDVNWKGRIRAACRTAKLHALALAENKAWQKQFDNLIVKHGGFLPQDPIAVTAEVWQCDQCALRFPTKCALALHAHKVHQYRKISKYFAFGDVCAACGKLYHTRKRLTVHLDANQHCLNTLQSCFPPMDDSVVQEVDAWEREQTRAMRQDGWHPSKALLPVLRLHGPLLPPADSFAARSMRYKAVCRYGAGGSLFTQLQGRCEPQPEQPPQLWWQTKDLPAFLMQSGPGPHDGNGMMGSSDLAYQYSLLHIKCHLFVHFFSGYRRSQDLHTIVEQYTIDSAHQVFILSVDMCMQKEDANLAEHRAHHWWMARIRSGQVVGAGGGPPCETYTAARLLADGPSALRTADYPLGLPDNSASRQWQVLIGNRLVNFLWQALLELACVGGCGFFEHPQYPLWAAKSMPASVWCSRPPKLLKQFRCFCTVSFDQCTVGAPARKPTTLSLLRLEALRRDLFCRGDHGRCDHAPNSHVALHGRDSEGFFNTARCKVYPEGLNLAIGRAVADFILHRSSADLIPLPQEFAPFLYNNFEAADCIQPDFHG